MTSNEIRKKFLEFFENHGHKIIPSSSLIPNDPSVLFTTAGMQQFKPYYSNPEWAERDFGVKNVTTVQKCVRTGDIDEVGDNTHLTFFEMLGNFSFGGYGRKEAINYAYDFITKEMGLTISYVTVYAGFGSVPKDDKSKNIWKEIDLNLDIREEGSDVFWGPTGDSGPCGPTTEIYCKNSSGEDVEIWNIVFNEYLCDGSRDKLDHGDAKLTKLPILGIDTGMGLERLVSIVQKSKSVYDTDLFVLIINKIEELSGLKYGDKTDEEYIKEGEQCWVDTRKRMRVIADHVRTSVFMISDGVIPANQGAGSVLKNLIKRAIKNIIILGIESHCICDISYVVIEKYKQLYESLNTFRGESFSLLIKEIEQFNETEKKNNKLLEKFEKYLKGQGKSPITLREYVPGQILGKADNPLITGREAYILNTTYGISKEDIYFFTKDKGYILDEQGFDEELKKHKELSRTASAGMFKGGLANHSEKTIRLHTAHHLLLAGLQEIVSKDIKQKGSNITEERLRMDFICDHKLTDEEKQKVEDFVNDKIQRSLNVVRKEMPLAEAEKLGAQMEFGAKYPEVVSVYFIEDENGDDISKEFCGGPHVENTKELGHFKIQKEEAVASGIRRIKAILE